VGFFELLLRGTTTTNIMERWKMGEEHAELRSPSRRMASFNWGGFGLGYESASAPQIGHEAKECFRDGLFFIWLMYWGGEGSQL